MHEKPGFASTSRATDALLLGSISGEGFPYALANSIFAISHIFTNFADAMSAKVERTFRKVMSQLAFIELRHKHQISWRQAFRRSSLFHFKCLATILKIKEFSPDFLYYTINN